MSRRKLLATSPDQDAAGAIELAYSLGCLAALGDPDAIDILHRATANASRGATLGLLEQFRLGRRHESARPAMRDA